MSETFARYKSELHFDLSLYVKVKVGETHESVTNVATSTSTLVLFGMARSPKELELWNLIQSKGGADAVMNDEALLQEVVAFSYSRTAATDQQQLTQMVTTVRQEIEDDVGRILERNWKAFDVIFEQMKNQIIKELGQIVEDVGDRVVGVFGAGPHENINDPVSFTSRPA